MCTKKNRPTPENKKEMVKRKLFDQHFFSKTHHKGAGNESSNFRRGDCRDGRLGRILVGFQPLGLVLPLYLQGHSVNLGGS